MYAVKWLSVKDNRPKKFAQTWQQLVRILSFHAESEDKYKGYLYSPVEYLPGASRGNKNVVNVNAFVADLDGEELADTLSRIKGFEYIAYTTYSHSSDEQHWHIVIPFAEPVPSHQWYSVWKQMHDFLGIVGDPQTSDPARIFFAPQHAPGNEFEVIRGHGEIMDAPEFRYTDRPPVTVKTSREPQRSFMDCTCTLTTRCPKCIVDFQDVDLSRYNGLSTKEMRADMRQEFSTLMESHWQQQGVHSK